MDEPLFKPQNENPYKETDKNILCNNEKEHLFIFRPKDKIFFGDSILRKSECFGGGFNQDLINQNSTFIDTDKIHCSNKPCFHKPEKFYMLKTDNDPQKDKGIMDSFFYTQGKTSESIAKYGIFVPLVTKALR